jgi:hypothetical protein
MNRILIGLVTYKGSKYLSPEGEHDIFTKLIDVLGNDLYNFTVVEGNFFIADNNSLLTEQYRRDLKEIFQFNKNLYSSILRKSVKRNDGFLMRRILGIYIDYLYRKIEYILLSCTNKTDTIITRVRRQANITLAHMSLFEKALKTKSEWIVVLEDDIDFKNVNSVKSNLESLIELMSENLFLEALNISDSFGIKELGMKNLPNRVIEPKRTNEQKIIIPTIPNTDTVCATIYRVNSLTKILQELYKKEELFSIPIDIKMNMVYSHLISELKSSKYCYGTVKNGIFIQKSLLKNKW